MTIKKHFCSSLLLSLCITCTAQAIVIENKDDGQTYLWVTVYVVNDNNSQDSWCRDISNKTKIFALNMIRDGILTTGGINATAAIKNKTICITTDVSGLPYNYKGNTKPLRNIAACKVVIDESYNEAIHPNASCF